MIKIYDYFRSTASQRVRIALALKACDWEAIPIHLLNHGGEQHHDHYQAINPQELVPSLVIDENSQPLTQSLAIIEYLNEVYPTPPLLPSQAPLRAYARSLALSIACDMHPLNNLRVLQYLRQAQWDEAAINSWIHHWLQQGLQAFQQQLTRHHWQGPFCLNEAVSLADLCLIPQLYSARRYHLPLESFSILCQIEEHCLSLPAFANTYPENNAN